MFKFKNLKQKLKDLAILPILVTMAFALVASVTLFCILVLESPVTLKADDSLSESSEVVVSEVSEVSIKADISDTVTESEPEESLEESIPEKVLIDTPLLFTHLDYKTRYDIDLNEAYITEIKESLDQLQNAIESEDFTAEAITVMQTEFNRLTSVLHKAEDELVRFTASVGDDYYAAKVWEYFTSRGYSEVVTSAIIGNMMIETSGGSISLNPMIYNPERTYYGLCQWALKYRPEVAGMNFEDQLDYLEPDIAKEFKTFGKCYQPGFTYDDFLAMTDPGEAALAFAKVYERCGSGSYEKRKEAAWLAYRYFNP